MDLRYCSACENIHGEGTACPDCKAPLVLKDESFFLGKFFGKYLVDRVLGMGGMGIVYRAVHTTLNRLTALKIILPNLSDETFIHRFQREAQLLADLKHPNIVQVYDYDISEWGLPYYVMEFLEGETLRDTISRHPVGFSYPGLCEHIHYLASALRYAHKKGVVHRDLKPENIHLVPFDDRVVVKILDFGIAKILEDRQKNTSNLTGTGVVLGTPQYMAPEQIMGGEIDPRTDQYALALIAGEMLTGKAIRAGKTFGEIISQELSKPLPLDLITAPDIPAGAGEALHRATQPDPLDRFDDVGAFADAFCSEHRAFTGEGKTVTSHNFETAPTISITPTSPFLTVPRKRRIWPYLTALALGAAALILFILFAGGGELNNISSPEPPPSSLLNLTGTFALPPDTARILGSQRGSLLLEGAGGVYLFDSSNPTVPGRIHLQPGESIAGVLEDGRVVVQSSSSVHANDYTKNSSISLADSVPDGYNVRVSPNAEYLAFFTGNHAEVHRVQKGGITHELFEFSAEKELILGLTVSNSHVVAVEKMGDVTVRHLPEGEVIMRSPFSEGQISTLSIQDEAGLVAVGGWFDPLYVFRIKDGSMVRALSLPGITRRAIFLPDHPTLAAVKSDTLHLWRPGGEIAATHHLDGREMLDVRWTSVGLAVLAANPKELLLFSYRDISLYRKFSAAKKEIWGLAPGPDPSSLFVGSADGELHFIRENGAEISTHDLHTQGITSIVSDNTHLATASDDKTIAVWKIPEMKVIWRSRAHDFLVNSLFLNRKSSTLWSSSSDGSIKSWQWPGLDPVSNITAGSTNNAAIWVDGEEKLALLGTWTGKLVVLKRDHSTWRTEAAYDLQSEGGYCLAHAEDLDLVMLVGTSPSNLYLIDTRTLSFYRVKDLGLDLYWAKATGDGSIVVAGENALLFYTFHREEERITYDVSARLSTDLGTVYVIETIDDNRGIAAGNSAGEITLVKMDENLFAPLAENLIPVLQNAR